MGQFIGAAIVAIIGFILVIQQTAWIQLVGIVLMVIAVGMGLMGDMRAAASRE
jgi:threonine/homoserine efflux transporter RhtA